MQVMSTLEPILASNHLSELSYEIPKASPAGSLAGDKGAPFSLWSSVLRDDGLGAWSQMGLRSPISSPKQR